ncbi:uncharacterized protein LOC119397888 [Rhipicephalus sanguineus]|uniref:uncharacterized protein LOC119397888 n=1 Tax=Rhipicephalus sanguineus TaxID=34632 RepID=UPI00189478C2|nr:uncharacterized protein LOC119397888 [Rhipicephalus sanguineus]
MGRFVHTVSFLLLLVICLELTIGSILYCGPPNHQLRKHAVKKARVSGRVRELMKKYERCLRSDSTRMLIQKYGFNYNISACNGDLSPDEICNNPDRVAEFYDCYFKQHYQIFRNANATAEEQMKMQTFWKCMKDAFKGFQHAVMRKR